ncbi:hypothetical protein J7K27_11260 [Candidatus Bathyarchaeota archaeon]|nr:hypothetical protein [Candidatus Bathyarchaeota archaeon]
MKESIWFQTNLGFETTWNNLRRLHHQGKVVIIDGPWKGRVTFYLRDFKDYIVQITTKGKLGIYYPQDWGVSEVIDILLKNCLLTPEGKPAEILSVLYSTEDEVQEPAYVPPPDDFRIYREIFEKISHLKSKHPSRIKAVLKELCDFCRSNRKICAIPSLCKKCNGSLYNLVEEKLAQYFQKRVPSSAIVAFLFYEYKSLLFICAVREIKRVFSESTDQEFDDFYISMYERIHRLEDWDASLEPKIKDWVLLLLPIIDLKDAEKAIRLCMEAVKWHLINELTMSTRVYDEFNEAYNKFLNDGRKIINRAKVSPVYMHSRKIFKKAIKRAFKKCALQRKRVSDIISETYF